MSLWYVSFFTGIVSIIALYYSLQLDNERLRITAVIAFSLLLMGETFDLLANIALDTILLFFTELLEMFVSVGFCSLVYYINILKLESLKRKKKSNKKE